MIISVVSLGGTIASYRDNGIVKLGKASPAHDYLVSRFADISFPEISPISYSSENATPEDYRVAIRGIVAEISRMRDADECPDGMIILHGTDTLAFFAQLAARTLTWLGIPVVVTGAKRPMDTPDTDAYVNLDASVEYIKSGRSGVVFTRNGESQTALIPLELVMSPDIYGDYGCYEDGAAVDFNSTVFEERTLEFINSDRAKRVLVIPAVPGAIIPDKGFDVVLAECHHSGTADIKLYSKIRDWTDNGIEVCMAPVPSEGNIYESREMLENAGAKVLAGMPFEGAWAEVLL